MPTPLDPLFEVCSWPAPRKVYPLGSEMNSSDCSRHVSETDGERLAPLCCVNELSETRIRLQSAAILREYVQPIEFPRS